MMHDPLSADRAARQALLTPAELFGAPDRLGGGISAEHGTGGSKQAGSRRRVDPVALDLPKRLKHMLDPRVLLSAGRFLPSGIKD